MTTQTRTEAQTAIESGTEIFLALNKLKKSPKNARKTPHGEAAIEALAASIAAKGMLQNLVVEPELNADGGETGFYFVTIGEGRRLAQLLRASRKQIKKSEPIRCVLDTANDPHEISLDENVTRTNMHPADQFEAFQRMADERGYGAEEIAARFGVTPQIVRQRLRLGAVSPKLMQVYRDGGLTLDQLSAFAISEDHARQEQVYENLSWNKEPAVIRRAMTQSHVPASDRRALFVGATAYAEAGGVILRDLFSEDGGGYFQDAVLLDRLTLEKLVGVADAVRAEGWKWAQAFLDYPHAHGLRRTYPQQVDLSAEDQERLTALQTQFDALSAAYEREDVLPPEVEADYNALEAEIEQLSARRFAYDPDAVARGGVFVVLNHDGTARIERGFIRPEDEATDPEIEADVEGAEAATGDGEAGEDEDGEASASDPEDEEAEDGKPLSDLLVRDLTAHRTLGLRLALGEQPDMALIAVTHALVAQAAGKDVPAPSMTTPGAAAQSPQATAAQQARQQALQVQSAARASKLFTSSDAVGSAGAGGAAPASEGAPSTAALTNPASSTSAAQTAASQTAQTSQSAKRAFLDAAADKRTTSADRLTAPASPYVVQAGSVIAAALITGLRSDLPGQITAQVTENIYDSPTGRTLLIPQGSRLVGEYDSQVAFGQERVLLAWTRLILPDGRSIALERQPGSDAAGYAGLEDGVDNHWGKLFQAAILSTLLSVGSEAGTSQDENNLAQAIRAGAANSFSQTGQQIVEHELTIQPTLTIRPGYPVRVMVTHDLVLEPYRQ